MMFHKKEFYENVEVHNMNDIWYILRKKLVIIVAVYKILVQFMYENYIEKYIVYVFEGIAGYRYICEL